MTATIQLMLSMSKIHSCVYLVEMCMLDGKQTNSSIPTTIYLYCDAETDLYLNQYVSTHSLMYRDSLKYTTQTSVENAFIILLFEQLDWSFVYLSVHQLQTHTHTYTNSRKYVWWIKWLPVYCHTICNQIDDKECICPHNKINNHRLQ